MGNRVIYRADVNLSDEPKTPAAYGRLLPKYELLRDEELVVVNADVTRVVSTVSAAATRMASIASDIVKIPDYDAQDIEELQDCADGLDFAEAEYRATLKTMNELSDLAQECMQTRERFVVDLKNVAAHGMLEEGYLKEYTGGKGFSAMIDDVRLLCRLYRNHWETLSGNTCRKLEEVERAEAVIHRMGHLMGLKNLGTAEVTRTAQMRNRAFTYLVKRYDRMCRAVAFARWEKDDAEQFAPSLYANRGGKRKSQPDKDEAQRPGAQQPQQPAIGPNGPFVTAPVSPSASGGSNVSGGNGSPTTPQRLPGMPGGSPFIQ